MVLVKRRMSVLGMLAVLHYGKDTKAHHKRKEKFPLRGCVQFYDYFNWNE
jgi:hypothetical protein